MSAVLLSGFSLALHVNTGARLEQPLHDGSVALTRGQHERGIACMALFECPSLRPPQAYSRSINDGNVTLP